MFKASEVALQLGISRRHVYSLYQKGELVGYRFGDAVRFDPADVEAYRGRYIDELADVARAYTKQQAGHLKSVLHAMHGGQSGHFPREPCA